MSETANVNQNYQTAAANVRETAQKSVKAVHQATEKAGKIVEASAAATNESVQKAFVAGSEAVTKAFDQAAGAAKEAVSKVFPQAVAPFETVVGFQRANLAAAIAVGTAAMRGTEAMASHLMAFNGRSVEDGVAATEKLFASRSVPEALELQTRYAIAQFQNAMAQSGHIAELATRFAHEIAEPVQARFDAAVERLGKPLGA